MQENVFTKGTESLIVGGKLSYLPTNEDYCIVVEVTDIEDGIVTGKKIWDLATVPQSFVAALYYHGSDEVPTEDVLEVGQYTVFYRVGDFASVGDGGTPPLQFEKHSQDETKVSWICFAEKKNVMAVKIDSGLETAKLAYRDSGSWVTTGDSKTLNILSRTFYNSNPESMLTAGDVYIAIEEEDGFWIQIDGMGELEETYDVEITGIGTITLELDATGKVLDFYFTPEEEE